MNRVQLADKLPYRFVEPRIGAPWLWLGRLYARAHYLPHVMRVSEIEVRGLDRLKALLGRGDGVVIAPNHPDHADAAVMLDVGRRAGRPFYFMAASQVVQGNGRLGRFLLPRIGAFPVDREGSDLRAFKTGVEIAAKGEAPLVIFPEGEIYHVCDRLTPIREGVAAIATSAAKRASAAGRSTWIVPAAIKYRFVEGVDPTEALARSMDQLEDRFTWWPRRDRSLIARIYAFAEGMLALKELEYLGAAKSGAIPERIATLRDSILDGLEGRLFGKRRSDPAPVRVKEIRHSCIEKLADPSTTPAGAAELRRNLNDAFVAVQLFSYPGDYLRDRPTVERVAETLMKFEQDVIGVEPVPAAPRRAIVAFGEPIDVGTAAASQPRPRLAASAITADLAARIQGLLDDIGPGHLIVTEGDGGAIVPRFDVFATGGAS